jgi:hypothetical protein
MKTYHHSANHKPRHGSFTSWVKEFWDQSFRDRIGLLLGTKNDANCGPSFD